MKTYKKTNNRKIQSVKDSIPELNQVSGIEFYIVRTSSRSLSMRLKHDGKLYVYAYNLLPREKIFDFIERKRSWINKKFTEYGNKIIPTVISDGAELSLAGKKYIVRFSSEQTFIDEKLVVLTKNNYATDLELIAKKVLLNDIAKKCAFYSEKYGYKYIGIKINNAKTRWGSCSAKNSLNFTFRLAFLPEELINYVVVHELCHTVQKNHKQAFWKEVGRVLPDYKQLVKWLNKYSLFSEYPA